VRINKLRLLNLIFLILIAVIAAFPGGVADALSPEQKKLIDSNALYYNIDEAPQVTEGTCVAGDSNEEVIWNYLVGEMGFSAEQAAGVMGNIFRESGYSPTAENPSSGAYGIIQWLGSRKTSLQEFAVEQGKDISDIGMQLDFMKVELEGTYRSSVLEPIQNSTSIEEAADIWLRDFEIPCDEGSAAATEACFVDELAERMPPANAAFGKYGSNSGDSACTTVSGSAQELAQAILDNENIGLRSGNQSVLENIASGQTACPDVSLLYTVDPKLLELVATLGQNNTFTIASLHRGCTNSTVGSGRTSMHWQGKAVDISGSAGVNGTSFGYSPTSTVIQKFINDAIVLLPSKCEVGVPNSTYVLNTSRSGCTNIFVDIGTGAHLHFAVDD